MSRAPKKKTDGPDAQTEAFKRALQLWPGRGMVSCRVPNPPDRPHQACEIGFKEEGVFYVMGTGTTWAEAVEEANGRSYNGQHPLTQRKVS